MRRRILPLLVLLGACGDREPPRVAVMMSGAASQSAHIAASDNASSGGPQFEVWVRSAQEAVAADTAMHVAEQFAADPRVLGVVGHSNSPASLAASQIYNRVGVVQIAPNSSATSYSAAGPYSFRMVPGDDSQAAFLVDSAGAGWAAPSRIAVVYVNDDYGRSLYRALRPMLADPPVLEAMYGERMEEANLAALLREIEAARPDRLIWLGRPQRLRPLLRSLRASLPELRVLCGDACDFAGVYHDPAGDYVGLRFIRFTDPETEGAAFDSFRRAYVEATGEPPTSDAVLTHDAVATIAAALRGGARTREQVREYLVSLGRGRAALEGLAGPIAFDDNGDLRRSYLLADVTSDGVRAVAGRHR
jgi:branched-chain amino acid transport system substrate-binding protein